MREEVTAEVDGAKVEVGRWWRRRDKVDVVDVELVGGQTDR